MNTEELIASQLEEQRRCIDAILSSDAPKKIIVSGPGTGKTTLFCEVLERTECSNNLVLTFIRRLVNDLDDSLCSMAEVKTFHAFCKKILHEQVGQVELIPYLTRVIEKDAELLDADLADFDRKFQELDEAAQEIDFYVRRGDYYGAVSFDDSIYRLYRILREDPDIVPRYEQIIIDEYQDFNRLEVAFISELESRGSILVVGDDDQAVYDDRSASSEYIRSVYKSDEFVPFPLPFCCRCTDVVVKASNAFIEEAQGIGYLKNRIAKDFTCLLAAKSSDSRKYSKLIHAVCKTGQTVSHYLSSEISQIPDDDIAESWSEGKEYPAVLVVGKKQYLNIVFKELRKGFPQVEYEPSKSFQYSLIDGYERLLVDADSNLGWRILTEYFLDREDLKRLLRESEKDIPLREMLDGSFVRDHLGIIDILIQIKDGVELDDACRRHLKRLFNDDYDSLISHFSGSIEEDRVEYDRNQPRILLTSFKGCKGLSGGHVFIIGANNGDIPKDPNDIDDLEISQFIVALTRTRKQCHIISNKWLFGPRDKNGRIPSAEVSTFVSWLPSELIKYRGVLGADDLR